MMTLFFDVVVVRLDARTMSYGETLYGVYTTLNEARVVAKTDLKNQKWRIYRRKLLETNLARAGHST